MYVPKFKQTKALFTQGEDFLVEQTLVPYKGYYIKLSNGDAYSGDVYKRGQSLKLIPIQQSAPQQEDLVAVDYDIITQDLESLKLTKTLPVPSYIPTRNDQDAKIQRFFAKSKIDGRIIEISKQTYLSLENKETIYHYPTYQILQVEWFINSPANDVVVSGHKVEGSITKNRRQILQAEKAMPGISQYLNPSQLVG